MRELMVLFLFLAGVASAESDCADAYTECKDDCVLEFGGSARVDMKKRFDKCMKKCTKTASRCDERVTETIANKLDEGALDKSPASDEVDADKMPRTRKKKKATAEPGGEEDLTPAKRHDDLSDAEVPKSNRTTLKTEEEVKPATKAPTPTPTPTPAAPKDEPVRTPEIVKSEPEVETAPPQKRPEEKPKEPPKKKEEDHDDLRNY